MLLIAEADYLRWQNSSFDANYLKYNEVHSALSIKDGDPGYLSSSGDENVYLEGTFVVAFRARALSTVCFTRSANSIYTSALVFESMPRTCPIKVEDPPLDSKIVGGTAVNGTANGEAIYFSWFASVWMGSKKIICGGSHIAPGFVLTAAHCKLQIDLSAFQVRIGMVDSTQGSLRGIERIWVHPEYKELASGDVVNDVAILQLKNRDRLTDKHVIMWSSNLSEPTPREYVTTAGFGRLSEGWSALPSPNMLRRVDVPVWTTRECRGVYAGFDSATQICAGEREGGCDSCQ